MFGCGSAALYYNTSVSSLPRKTFRRQQSRTGEWRRAALRPGLFWLLAPEFWLLAPPVWLRLCCFVGQPILAAAGFSRRSSSPEPPAARTVPARALPGGRGRNDHCASNDLDQRIARNPLNSHASARRGFAWAEVSAVDFVQRVVLRFMGIEPGFARRHWDIVGVRKADKNLHMDDAVHGAACSLNGSLECIHRPGDVLLKWVRYENVIVSGVAVIGTGAGEVIDAILCVVVARPISSRAGCWCARLRRLLSEENACAGHAGHHCREFMEAPASRVDLHTFLHSENAFSRALGHPASQTLDFVHAICLPHRDPERALLFRKGCTGSPK